MQKARCHTDNGRAMSESRRRQVLKAAVSHRAHRFVAIGRVEHVVIGWPTDDKLPDRLAQGVFQEKSAKIGDRTSFLF